MKSLLLKSLCLFFLLCFPLYGAEFQLKGDRLENLELVFQSSGVDRSTPKGTVTGLLTLKAKAEDLLMFKLRKMAFTSKKAMVGSLFSPKAIKTFFGREEKQIQKMESLRSTYKTDFMIKFEKEEKSKDGTVTIFYSLAIHSQSACLKCVGKKGNDKCYICRGKGISEQKRTERGKITLLQKGKNWLITRMLKKCFYCQGKGNCPRCKKPGVKCALCLGTGKCRQCKGSGWKKDPFLKGPGQIKKPLLKPLSLAQSSPQETLESFGKVVSYSNSIAILLASGMYKGFQDFLKFFIHPDHMPLPDTSKFPQSKIIFKKLLPLTKTTCSVIFEKKKILALKKKKPEMGSHPVSSAPPVNPMMKMDLQKGKDGKWLITTLYRSCYSCHGRGFTGQYSCPDHKNLARQPGKCSQCGKKMALIKGSLRKCYTCQGSGFMKMTYFYF